MGKQSIGVFSWQGGGLDKYESDQIKSLIRVKDALLSFIVAETKDPSILIYHIYANLSTTKLLNLN